ncbi:MAG TPA: DUF6265 family protein [Allosphingosinicella sp.]|nr:DUF6265 family protein [Allosphingosinicella sp.]
MARAWLAAFALAAAWPGPAMAETPRAPASIEAAGWLAGRWVGEGLGGQVEESWAPPLGGQMVGHFRLVREGRPVFYELMLIDLHDGGLRLRVKHFNPDFTGWEARDASHVFPPRAAAPGDLRFDGLRYRLEGDVLVATVRIEQNGRAEDVSFRLRRTPL